MTAVKIPGDRKKAIKELLKKLLEKEVVKYVLSLARTPKGDSFAYVLTKDPEIVNTLTPISPVMPVNGARVVSKLTKKGSLKGKVAVVMRPCELRAMRELIKLNQVNPEGIISISFDCPGVYTLENYIRAERERLDEIFIKSLGGLELPDARPLCQICRYFTGEFADIEVGFIGAPKNEFYVIAHTIAGEEALISVGYEGKVELKEREDAIDEAKKLKIEKREVYWEEFSNKASGTDALLGLLHECISCHNCMRVCPVCFCRECFFESDAFRVSSENYLMRASRKNGLRFPPDMLLFHLGRMNHMSLCCVSCGMCEDACPSSVPVSQLFAFVSEKTQAIFDYVPGRDVSEPIPFVDYKEEELEEYEKPYIDSLVYPPSQ